MLQRVNTHTGRRIGCQLWIGQAHLLEIWSWGCDPRRGTAQARYCTADGTGVYRPNLTGTLNLLTSAIESGVGRFVFTSTT